jgi:flagellar basal-body rod modification protein FlgD
MANVTAASQASTTRTLEELNKTRNTGKSLGQDDFLKILVAQMSNQDPMEPTGNAEFLAQMAQFTMLEQIKEMSASFSTSQAYSMVGKYVYVQNGDDGLIFGKVDGVVKEKGTNYLLIGGKTYDAADVAGVMDSTAVESGPGGDILESANLIGCTVTASVTAEDGTATPVTGEVSRIVVQDDTIYAVVGEQKIPVSDITEISND